MEEDEQISLITKIDDNYARTRCSDNFLRACYFHLKIIEEEKSDTKNDYTNLLLSKFFVDKMSSYLAKEFHSEVNENSDWPFPLPPYDSFGEKEFPKNFRTTLFYELLKIGDWLDCRVTAVFRAKYHLKVMHKYGTNKCVNDLNIMVKMPRSSYELKILEKALFVNEFVRVSVSKIVKDVKEVIVNIIHQNGPEPERIAEKLGRISDKDIPSYELSPEPKNIGKTVSQYIDDISKNKNIHSSTNKMYIHFNFQLGKHLSYYPEYDRHECSDKLTGQFLLKESRTLAAKQCINSAREEGIKGRTSEALKLYENALQLCSSDHLLRTIVYQNMAEIFYDIEFPQKSPELKIAVLGFITAIHVDKGNVTAKSRMSKLLFKAANGLYQQKKYQDAAVYVKIALKLDEKNDKATELLEYLNIKHLGDKVALLEIKKKLESELQQLGNK